MDECIKNICGCLPRPNRFPWPLSTIIIGLGVVAGVYRLLPRAGINDKSFAGIALISASLFMLVCFAGYMFFWQYQVHQAELRNAATLQKLLNMVIDNHHEVVRTIELEKRKAQLAKPPKDDEPARVPKNEEKDKEKTSLDLVTRAIDLATDQKTKMSDKLTNLLALLKEIEKNS